MWLLRTAPLCDCVPGTGGAGRWALVVVFDAEILGRGEGDANLLVFAAFHHFRDVFVTEHLGVLVGNIPIHTCLSVGTLCSFASLYCTLFTLYL